MSITGEPSRAPVRMGIPLGDLAGAIFAALAIASALLRRQKEQKGFKINVSLLDALTSMLTYLAQYYFADGKIPQPQGSKHISCVPYGAYKTKDIYIVVAVFTERFWERFCDAIEHPELAKDKRFSSNQLRVKNREILEPMLQEIFQQREGAYWLQRLYARQIPASPVNTIDQILSSEQLLMRNMILKLSHPIAGEIKTLGYPIKIENLDDKDILPSPLLGEHTDLILSEILGLTPEELQKLRMENII
jgi:crotonobetainyl-CoA:carnitine CoA-transferase CaiB-like acyl-CoA transferase